VPEKQSGLGRFFLTIDRIVDGFCIFLLVIMILIVVMAVVTRKGFGFMFAWSEEITLLCLTWFTFMGIAIGFRERLHLGMDLVDPDKLPRPVNLFLGRLVDLVTFLFGLYLVIYGTNFAISMRGAILPATEMPNMVQYIVLPITGVLTCVYAALQFLGRDLRRFNVIEEEIKRDAE
jgi:TRAP-type C4-dicarboxylate transport system permease small subunit